MAELMDSVGRAGGAVTQFEWRPEHPIPSAIADSVARQIGLTYDRDSYYDRTCRAHGAGAVFGFSMWRARWDVRPLGEGRYTATLGDVVLHLRHVQATRFSDDDYFAVESAEFVEPGA